MKNKVFGFWGFFFLSFLFPTGLAQANNSNSRPFLECKLDDSDTSVVTIIANFELGLDGEVAKVTSPYITDFSVSIEAQAFGAISLGENIFAVPLNGLVRSSFESGPYGTASQIVLFPLQRALELSFVSKFADDAGHFLRVHRFSNCTFQNLDLLGL